MNLFEHANRYPNHPGHKARDTSRAAADAIAGASPKIRDKIYTAIKASDGLTADEACHRANVSLLSGRPRVTELMRVNLVHDTGRRRELNSGKMGIVWARTAPKRYCGEIEDSHPQMGLARFLKGNRDGRK